MPKKWLAGLLGVVLTVTVMVSAAFADNYISPTATAEQKNIQAFQAPVQPELFSNTASELEDIDIFYSDDTWLWDEPVTGVKSSISADIDGDGKNETAEMVVSQDEGKKWTLVYKDKDGNWEASVPIFKGNENGFATSIAAGHITGENTTDFLVSSNYLSMPFGGCDYELYSLKDGVFTKIDVSEITDGTEFDISVDERQKKAKLLSYHSKKTVVLSDQALSDYKLYGKEFCQDFFIAMELQSAKGYSLPDLVTTEVIAAVLPNNLTYLHTTYRYTDGAWKVLNVEFYDLEEVNERD